MKKIYLGFLASMISLLSFGQVSITAAGTPYTEDFNTLALSGTSSTLPTGWVFLETGTGNNTTYAADNGTANSGNTYSYGTTASAERAFGGLLSGSVTPSIGVSFTNNTGVAIESITISYTGEQWRIGTLGRADKLDFQYSINATALNTGTYVDADALDFTAPATTGTIGALDGNALANKAAVSATISGLNLPVGATIWFRWNDFNATGADDGLAVDDFSATFIASNLPPCDEVTDQPTALILTATAVSVEGSFTPIPDPTVVENYLVVRSLDPALTVLPADGVTYSAGQTIPGGNGTVIGASSGTFANAIAPSTQYYYFVFAINDQDCAGGPNYNQISPLTETVTTPALAVCATPTAPTVLGLTPANTTVNGSFTGSGASKYLTVISLSTPFSGTLTNGTIYSVGQTIGNGTVVSYNAGTTFTAGGLTVATQYYIYVFAANDVCTGEPVYSATSLDGTVTTTNVVQGIPAGYYDAATGLSCQPLKTAVKNIISSNTQVLSYTPGLWNLYLYSDMHRNDANTADIIWDMYSDNPAGPEPYVFSYGPVASGGNQCGTYGTEGDCYNREHSTPQSWFAEVSPMVSDAHHIFPTDGEVNNMRSNFPFGEVTNLSSVPQGQNNPSLNGSKLGTGSASQNFGYTGTVFEPIDAYKGDFARAGLYMAVRYEDEIISQNWSAKGTANAVFLSPSDEMDAANRRLQIYDPWYLKTLIKWSTQDPVSQKEIDRNNAIYYTSVNTVGTTTPKVQGNRNPFVDHPEYAALIFQCTKALPVTVLGFTAVKSNETVLLKWAATFETNFKQFDVQRSTDGLNFNTIGEVAGRNLSNYSFTDNNLPNTSIVYYRLKMVDIDGKNENSKVVPVKLNNNFSNALVYPNPTMGNLNIKLESALAANSLLQVTDIAGRVVKTQNLAARELNIALDVKALPSGRYFIRISNAGQTINQSFVVIK